MSIRGVAQHEWGEAEDIRWALQDASYPASKDALVDVATRGGGDEAVQGAAVTAHRGLPQRGRGDPFRAHGGGHGAVRRRQAVRAREASQAGLAEHMRDRQAPRLDPD